MKKALTLMCMLLLVGSFALGQEFGSIKGRSKMKTTILFLE